MNKSNLGPCGVLFRVPNGTVPKLSLLPLASDEVSGRIIGLAGWLVRLTMSARTDLLKHKFFLGKSCLQMLQFFTPFRWQALSGTKPFFVRLCM